MDLPTNYFREPVYKKGSGKNPFNYVPEPQNEESEPYPLIKKISEYNFDYHDELKIAIEHI